MRDDLEPVWDELLAYIDARSVIPIIGPELAVVFSDGREQPYRQVLAQYLAARFKLPPPDASARPESVVANYSPRPTSSPSSNSGTR